MTHEEYTARRKARRRERDARERRKNRAQAARRIARKAAAGFGWVALAAASWGTAGAMGYALSL